jgi:hypothetical protein
MFQRILLCGEYQFKTKNGQSVEARGSFEKISLRGNAAYRNVFLAHLPQMEFWAG